MPRARVAVTTASRRLDPARARARRRARALTAFAAMTTATTARATATPTSRADGDDGRRTGWTTSLAGAIAGATARACVAPLDVIKIRMQVQLEDA